MGLNLMLNILNNKSKNNYSNSVLKLNSKHYLQDKIHISSTKEWYNSTYGYNNNTIKNIIVSDEITIKLIKYYFNLFVKKLTKKKWLNRLNKLKKRLKLLQHKIHVSKAEFKHTSDKVIVTIYIYNREKYNFLNKIRKIRSIVWLKNKKFKRKLKLIKSYGFKIEKKINKQIKILTNTLKLQKISFLNYQYLYFNKFIKLCFKKDFLVLYYRYLIYVNKLKKNIYIQYLSFLLSKIYNKKVELNIVSLKYIYSNSDILSNSVAIKLRKKKNRAYPTLKRVMGIIRFRNLNNKLTFVSKYNFEKKNKKPLYFSETKKVDILQQSIYDLIKKKTSCKTLIKNVLNSIKYKDLAGIRLEAKGRLTKRLIASRAISKLAYKGSLRNVYSSYSRFSTDVLRGYKKSGIEYSYVGSRTRNGSFGLKGWLNSY